MSGEEFIIAIVSVVFGSIVLIVGISKIAGLIKSWIERDKGGYREEDFNRLARAFMQHKKEMERRVQQLEAIVTDEEPEADISYPELEEPKSERSLNNDLESKKQKQQS